ncbi:unnamed protein product [Rotaria magnacalcarata]|uniref:DUF4371 domain-containing protein n=1 Tax=Rotaria magnacalcarata TaxID=392030 RepID=A0A816SS79_9BILA|nr:unnamed protein product [Rotaria magnacalcarata]
MKTFSVDMVKRHKEQSEVHKQAEQQELTVSCGAQPDWTITQQRQLSKHEQAIHNLMMACIYICQQDLPLNSLQSLCILLEKLGITLLPAEVSGVSYRNNKAALGFIQHIASFLHEELLEKIKCSPVVGWMMDESTSRSTDKMCIVYVRYIEDDEPKTSYYGLLDLQGDGSAKNIVKTLKCLWNKDDLRPTNSCWLSTDNASTFTGINHGVIAKLRNELGIDYLELNTCVAHSFALAGSQASYKSKISNGIPVLSESIVGLETTISKIYNYFGKSCTRQFKLKSWQNYLELPELKFKRIFNIRWSSIRNCIKPIVVNVQPGSQALFGCLEEAMLDGTLTVAERENSKELLNLVLNDEFLYRLHVHHDLHESVLGPVTNMMQNDHLSYFNLMTMIEEKKRILEEWTFESTSHTGPALSHYIDSTTTNTYGAFKISKCDRKKLSKDCLEHIKRLIDELERRFPPSPIQEHLSILFDPQYLITHKKEITSNTYGRSSLDFLRKSYQHFEGFDFTSVLNEWLSIKVSLIDYIDTVLHDYSPFSAVNKIQTIGRSRLMVSTLDAIMTMKLLLTDDLRSSRTQYVVMKSFESWNDQEYHRRLNQIQLLMDTPPDYEPTKQSRSVVKRNISLNNVAINYKKPKNPKGKFIKCANGCRTQIATNDPFQSEAIQCCHQSDQFNDIEHEDNCSRWLCNSCRIKLNIGIDSLWFCVDHDDMHQDEEENEDEIENENK